MFDARSSSWTSNQLTHCKIDNRIFLSGCDVIFNKLTAHKNGAVTLKLMEMYYQSKYLINDNMLIMKEGINTYDIEYDTGSKGSQLNFGLIIV